MTRTFEEAVLAVYHVDAPLLQTGSAVHLAVVLVEAAVGAAHRHEGGPALLLAHALGTARLRQHQALPAPAAVGPPAETPVRVQESCGVQKRVNGGSAGWLGVCCVRQTASVLQCTRSGTVALNINSCIMPP